MPGEKPSLGFDPNDPDSAANEVRRLVAAEKSRRAAAQAAKDAELLDQSRALSVRGAADSKNRQAIREHEQKMKAEAISAAADEVVDLIFGNRKLAAAYAENEKLLEAGDPEGVPSAWLEKGLELDAEAPAHRVERGKRSEGLLRLQRAHYDAVRELGAVTNEINAFIKKAMAELQRDMSASAEAAADAELEFDNFARTSTEFQATQKIVAERPVDFAFSSVLYALRHADAFRLTGERIAAISNDASPAERAAAVKAAFADFDKIPENKLPFTDDDVAAALPGKIAVREQHLQRELDEQAIMREADQSDREMSALIREIGLQQPNIEHRLAAAQAFFSGETPAGAKFLETVKSLKAELKELAPDQLPQANRKQKQVRAEVMARAKALADKLAVLVGAEFKTIVSVGLVQTIEDMLENLSNRDQGVTIKRLGKALKVAVEVDLIVDGSIPEHSGMGQRLKESGDYIAKSINGMLARAFDVYSGLKKAADKLAASPVKIDAAAAIFTEPAEVKQSHDDVEQITAKFEALKTILIKDLDAADAFFNGQTPAGAKFLQAVKDQKSVGIKDAKGSLLTKFYEPATVRRERLLRAKAKFEAVAQMVSEQAAKTIPKTNQDLIAIIGPILDTSKLIGLVLVNTKGISNIKLIVIPIADGRVSAASDEGKELITAASGLEKVVNDLALSVAARVKKLQDQAAALARPPLTVEVPPEPVVPPAPEQPAAPAAEPAPTPASALSGESAPPRVTPSSVEKIRSRGALAKTVVAEAPRGVEPKVVVSPSMVREAAAMKPETTAVVPKPPHESNTKRRAREKRERKDKGRGK
ncbi:MAG: hypothetical protein Q7K39_04830 [Candidatus Magasanikbacteria bacterium]|nr:hypothetical protein [Candidatus Magasanikbacteria bacterium]